MKNERIRCGTLFYFFMLLGSWGEHCKQKPC